jgi:hypothetical protein
MAIPSYKAVLKHFETQPDDVQQYFSSLPYLIEHGDWYVCIAYQFIRVETAQNRSLYCGVVKLHRAHPEVAGSVLYASHITRKSFLELLHTIFGTPLPADIASKLKYAEGVRDKIVHGKGVSDSDARQGIVDVLDYATAFNAHLDKCAGIRPFGDLRGFKGRGESFDKKTTSWLLKGVFADVRERMLPKLP